MEPTYVYAAKVLKIVDGDTLDILVDLGFDVHIKKRLRMAHLNAPERGTQGGADATAFLVDRLPLGCDIVVHTVKNGTDKWGRYLAEVYIDNKSVNEELLSKSLAVPYEGR